jgi:hypothetical protein
VKTLAGVLAVLSLVPCLVSCGGGNAGAPPAPEQSKVSVVDPSKWPADDKSMCDWKGKKDLEVNETAGPGALKPNVRRVYKMVGEGDAKHKSIICREIDTNLDGIKDVVRTFNAKGEAVHEEADSNFDGKLDVWVSFVNGRMSEEDMDTNYDGKIDTWKYYVDGQLSRIKRDTNFDGKPDIWEIYVKGKLERVGVDVTLDGHVDRWDRDMIAQRAVDDAEAATRAKMQGDAGAPVDAGDAGDAGDATTVDSGKKPTRRNK